MKNNTSNHPRYSVVAFASNGKVYGYAELICDEVADLDYLPTENTKIAVGSKCTCLANGKVYTLSNARQWVEDLSNQSDGTDEVYDPLEVSENGDVVVTYNGMKIAATEESGHITLETSGKRVDHDIEVEYTKPTGQTIGNVLNVQNNSANNKTVNATQDQGIFLIVNNTLDPLSVEAHATGSAILLSYRDIVTDNYYVGFTVPSKTDVLTVTVNGTPITHDGGYHFTSEASDSVIAGQTYNVVISDKE